MVRVPCLPSTPRLETTARTKVADGKWGFPELPGAGAAWRAAVATTEKTSCKNLWPAGLATQNLAFQNSAAAAARVGETFAEWITAAEVFHAKEAGATDDTLHNFIGRARGPRFKLVPILKALKAKRSIEDTFTQPTVRWWAVVSARLGELLKLRTENKGEKATRVGDENFAGLGKPAAIPDRRPRGPV